MALPVAPKDTCDRLRAAADRLVCLRTPDLFFAIGTWYLDFGQVADDDVGRKIDRSLVRVGGL